MSSVKLKDWFDHEHYNVSPIDLLDSDVGVIKGIGQKLTAALKRVGVSTVRDLANWSPCWAACKLLDIVPQSMNVEQLEQFVLTDNFRKAFLRKKPSKNNHNNNDDDDNDKIDDDANFQLTPVGAVLTSELLTCLATTPSTRIKTLRDFANWRAFQAALFCSSEDSKFESAENSEADAEEQQQEDNDDDDDFNVDELVSLVRSSLNKSSSSSTKTATVRAVRPPSDVEQESFLSLETKPNYTNLISRGLDSGLDSPSLLVKRRDGTVSLASNVVAKQQHELTQASRKRDSRERSRMHQAKLRQPKGSDAVKESKKRKAPQSGSEWFDMPSSDITEEIQRDARALQLRAYLDPKRRYKKEKRPTLLGGKFFQAGVVVEGAGEFYSSRLSQSERHNTLADELVADAGDVTRRYLDLQSKYQAVGKNAYKKRRRVARAKNVWKRN